MNREARTSSSGKMTLELWSPMGRFQTEETARAKALRQEPAWCVGGPASECGRNRVIRSGTGRGRAQGPVGITRNWALTPGEAGLCPGPVAVSCAIRGHRVTSPGLSAPFVKQEW